MIYTLVLTVAFARGGMIADATFANVVQIHFETMQACETARGKLLKSYSRGNFEANIVCIEQDKK